MKASDLRIGNIVLRENFDAWSYDKHQITVSNNDITACLISPDKFEPIKLTEKWLLKLGFTQEYENSNQYEKEGLGFEVYVFGPDDISVSRFGDYPVIDYELEYVHQLQNIFSAMTGKELSL